MPTTAATPPHAPITLEAARAKLAAAGQEHVLTFYPTLAPEQQAALLAQVAGLDLAALERLIDTYVRRKPAAAAMGSIEPVPYYPAAPLASSVKPSPQLRAWDRAAYRAKGEQLIREGKVAAFTVAGGQGSRLGYDGPKGCYPGGPVTGKPLFQCLAEWILAAQKRWSGPGRTIPWYIMTSPINHDATVAFFKQHQFFGLAQRDVMFFPQGVLPSFEMGTGKLLLSDKHEIAVNPDGHGGSLKALAASGALADMQRRGVEHISYTQIDNPLVRVIDPAFLGLHAFAPDSSAEMSSKMIPKTGPGEKVGVFCLADGKTAVVEYSDMPAELAGATNPDGSLKFLAGSIAIHVIAVEFVRRLTGSGPGFSLPYHRAEKKVPHIDLACGAKVEPEKPNAVKLETFVFDAVPLARASIVMETERTDEFAPIKNATGVDSPGSCAAIQTQRAARWLLAAGVRVPLACDSAPDCVLEISPLRAMDAEELRRGPVPAAIAPGASVALDTSL